MLFDSIFFILPAYCLYHTKEDITWCKEITVKNDIPYCGDPFERREIEWAQ